jgi:hypothetical protein
MGIDGLPGPPGVGWINDNVVVLNGPYYPCDAHLCTMGS